MVTLVFLTHDGHEIFADPDERGPWWCSCPEFGTLQGKDRNGKHLCADRRCRHLKTLWGDARDEGVVRERRFRPTHAGLYLMQHCRCGIADDCPDRVLTLVPAVAPPVPAPAPGMPSRNQPCPCGSVGASGRPWNFKECHGRIDGALPPEAQPWPKGRLGYTEPGHAPPPPPPPPPLPPETPAEEKRRRKRLERAAAALERRKRADEIIEREHALDEERRAKRAARAAARKALALVSAAERATLEAAKSAEEVALAIKRREAAQRAVATRRANAAARKERQR